MESVMDKSSAAFRLWRIISQDALHTLDLWKAFSQGAEAGFSGGVHVDASVLWRDSIGHLMKICCQRSSF